MESRPVIVLHTTGKNEEFNNLIIRLFDTSVEAEAYCKENTDPLKDQKYWSYCEIIQEGDAYEPSRYINDKTDKKWFK